MSSPPRVALCRGAERVANLRCALDQVLDEIDWPRRHNVVVKPNLVLPSQPLAVTNRDALSTVLEAVRARYDGSLTVAEGCALGSTNEAFRALGYDQVASFFRARLVDLNADVGVAVKVYGHRGGLLRVRLARCVLESDCRISLSLPKTHDAVLVTLSIKNMVMGALVNRMATEGRDRPAWRDRLGRLLRGHGNGWGSDKTAMHQGYPLLNINLALLASAVRPHVSVLDGFVAMEGAGPLYGSPVPWGVAIAGTDALAVDIFTARLMGFRVEEVGYLYYLARLGFGNADLEHLEVLGNATARETARVFMPHPDHEQQRQWHHPHAERLLRAQVQPATVA